MTAAASESYQPLEDASLYEAFSFTATDLLLLTKSGDSKKIPLKNLSEKYFEFIKTLEALPSNIVHQGQSLFQIRQEQLLKGTDAHQEAFSDKTKYSKKLTSDEQLDCYRTAGVGYETPTAEIAFTIDQGLSGRMLFKVLRKSGYVSFADLEYLSTIDYKKIQILPFLLAADFNKKMQEINRTNKTIHA